MLINAGDPAHSATTTSRHAARRRMPDVGAYEHTSATNPGWDPGEGFKSETPVTADTDVPNPADDDPPAVGNGSGCCDARTPGSSGLARRAVVMALRRRRRR